ncbi:MAG: hypothetical protein J6X18_14610, partial [Bacteroidales bacterium]|nr:hypothetical protein [Bacteroidales bacterium]
LKQKNMRYFNKIEQDFLQKIIKEGSIISLLYKEFPNADFQIIDNKIDLYVQNVQNTQDIESVLPIQERMAIFMNLLDYLQKEGLIYLLHEHNDHSGDTKVGGHTHTEKEKAYPIGDPNLKKYIISYSFSRIFVTEDLIDLVNHKFSHKEDRRHRCMLKATLLGALCSVVISLIQIIICGC